MIAGSCGQKQHCGYWNQPEPAADPAGWCACMQHGRTCEPAQADCWPNKSLECVYDPSNQPSIIFPQNTLLPGQLSESPSMLGLKATLISVTILSLQFRCIAMKLCLRHSEGPACSVCYGTRELLGWVQWSATWETSFSKVLRVRSRVVIRKERTVYWLPSNKTSRSLDPSVK